MASAVIVLLVLAAVVGALFLGVCIGWAAHRRHVESEWAQSWRLKMGEV